MTSIQSNLMTKTNLDNDKQLDILIHEHTLVNTKIDDFINAQFVYISSILTFASGFILVAVNNESFDATFLPTLQYFPYFFLIIGPTFMYKFNRAIILHGYRCFLEEKINTKVGVNGLLGAFLVYKKLLARNPFTIFNYLAMIALIAISTYFCHKYQSNFWNPNLFIQVGFMVLGVLFFCFNNGHGFKEGYLFGTSLYDEDHKLVPFKSEENQDHV